MHTEMMKKEMRKVLALSVLCIVLCVACLVPATMALFVVEVDSSENVVTVAEINGSIATTLTAREGEAQTFAIAWEGTAPGYCAFTLTGSEAGDITYYMERPAETIPDPNGTPAASWEEEDSPYSLFHVTFHEPGTALGDYVFSWGEPPEGSLPIQPDEYIEYGTKFVATATIDALPVDTGAQLCEVGTHLVSVNWSKATTTGYCTLTLTAVNGEDPVAVYYLLCPNGAGQRRETTFSLTLNVDAVVEITPQRGEPILAGELLTSEITYGNIPAFAAAISVDNNVYRIEDSSKQVFELDAGEHTLFFDWSEAALPGFCTIELESMDGEDETAVYYVDCSMQSTRAQTVKLVLNVGTRVTIITEKGSTPADGTPASGIIGYGTAMFEAADNVDNIAVSAEVDETGEQSVAAE